LAWNSEAEGAALEGAARVPFQYH
jgi:hypothetical protein